MKGRGDTSRAEAQKEVNLMAEAKKHSNIIRYFDHWFDQRAMFILMEYAPNGSLDTIISSHRDENRRFSELQVLHFLQQLASALAFLHDEVRMLHRDLKPENVLVGQFGELKLADFGLSKALAPGNDLCVTFVGSPLYMSPEICMGEEYSFSTDIWALGCIMFEVMALRSPWEDACKAGICTVPALLMKIGTTPPAVDELSALYKPKIVKTVKWMLRKTVSLRPSASQIVDLLDIRDPPVKDDFLRDTLDRPVSQPCAPIKEVRVSLEDSFGVDLECGATIRRRDDIVRDAERLVEAQKAVLRIQKSFRASVGRRPATPMRCPRLSKEREVARKAEEAQAAVIQKALRNSFQRRRDARPPVDSRRRPSSALPRPPPPPPRAPHRVPPLAPPSFRVPSRIDALAAPRLVRVPPRPNRVPPPALARPAWA